MLSTRAFKAATAFVSPLIVSMAAQGQEGVMEMPSIAPTMLQILNPTSAKVLFQISCVDEDDAWDEMSLDPHTNAQYYCESGAPYLWFQLRSAVQGKPEHTVRYQLAWTQRYEIVYSEAPGKWDVVRVAR